MDSILKRCPYSSMISVATIVRSVLTRVDRLFPHWTSTKRSSWYSPCPQIKSRHRNWTVSSLPYIITVVVWNSDIRLLNSSVSLIVLPFCVEIRALSSELMGTHTPLHCFWPLWRYASVRINLGSLFSIAPAREPLRSTDPTEEWTFQIAQKRWIPAWSSAPRENHGVPTVLWYLPVVEGFHTILQIHGYGKTEQFLGGSHKNTNGTK